MTTRRFSSSRCREEPDMTVAGRGLRRGRHVALAALALTALTAGCRKPPPAENVFTGKGSPDGKVPVVDPGPTPAWDGGVDPNAPPFTEAGLLADFSACALGRYRAFVPLATSLRDAAAAWAADASEARAQATRDAWTAAMAVWEEAELFQLGPAAASTHPGGRGLRDQIYAWPLFSRCKVEEQLVAKTYADPAFDTTLINARGLGAVEYLAFHAGTDNACSSFSAINANGSWAAIPAQELSARKAAYAQAAASVVHARATELLAAWEPSQGNFASQLANAGAGSTTFAARADALDAVNGALFYLDTQVKDLKLGKPIGYVDCESATCPSAVESPFARRSTDHLRANLIGFRRLFQGCGDGYSGLGFDDWLRAVGASDLADRMMGALVAAQAAVDALTPPLEEALVVDPTKAALVYARVKVLTDLLKTEFVTVLRLQLPRSAEGDND
jgi:predicted lipoprotein